MPLPTRPFGSTGFRATILGLGGGFLTSRSHDEGVATVRRALERGINYFDTSPMYRGGQSQAILGDALDGRREDYILATKLGYLPTRAAYHDPEALRAQLRENLRLLRRASVGVLQAHEADFAHWWSLDPALTGRVPVEVKFDFESAPIMRVLREARESGLCRWIGITGNGEAEMCRLLRGLDVDVMLLAFHDDLLHRDARCEALPLANKKGVALVLAGILQCGKLAEVHPEWVDSAQPRPEWMTPALQDAYRGLYALREESGLSLVELTIRFLLRETRQATILIGASRPAEVDHAVDAAEAGPLPDDLHLALEELA